jgi:transcriptional regulator with XRE-family HTH domain
MGMPLRTTAVEAAAARGWSKAELQRRTGLSLSLIYQLSRGSRPGAKAIAAIMQAFPDLPFERLFVPTDSRILQDDRSSLRVSVEEIAPREEQGAAA